MHPLPLRSLTLDRKRQSRRPPLGRPRLQYWPDSSELADLRAIVLARLDLSGLDGGEGCLEFTGVIHRGHMQAREESTVENKH